MSVNANLYGIFCGQGRALSLRIVDNFQCHFNRKSSYINNILTAAASHRPTTSSFCFAKDGLIGSNPAKQSKQKNNRHSFVSVIFWLGWQDSNLRMQQSKCCVLPLDDTPILSLLSILIFQNILIFRKGI